MATIPTKKILLAAVIIFVVGAILYQLTQRSPAAPDPSSGSVATSTKFTLATPNFKEAINFSASITPEIRTQLNKTLGELQAELTVNPLNLLAWQNLGAVYKMGGDYPHAIAAWDFITEVIPNNAGPYSNLGDLYMYFIKDYPKAEANYKKVIALKPETIAAYKDLYTLYRYMYKTDTSAAADIVAEGLRNNPNNAELLRLQEEIKK